MDFGVTPEGYVLKTQDEINADAETDLKEVRDPITGQQLAVDFSDSSDIVTQITAIPLENIGISFAQQQAAYNAFDPGKVTGDAQSNLALIHGIKRLAASASTVLLNFTGSAFADVPQGFRVTDVNREINWTTTESFTFTGGAVAIGIAATCDTVGSISAPINSLIKFVSNPGATIKTVTNPAAATIGRAQESDQSLRQREDISNSKPAFGFPTAINANILNVSGVTFSREYTNKEQAPDANGIPGKALAAVVVGGDNVQVAQAILQSLTAGQLTDGNTPVEFIVDGFPSDPEIVTFYRPDPQVINIIVDLILTGDELFPEDGAQRVKQAIVDYSTGGAPALGITDDFNTIGFPPGSDILVSRLYTPINSVPGHRIDNIRISIDPVLPVASNDIPINFNQVGVFDVINITVGVT